MKVHFKICRNYETQSCQHGPESLRNAPIILWNPCHLKSEEQKQGQQFVLLLKKRSFFIHNVLHLYWFTINKRIKDDLRLYRQPPSRASFLKHRRSAGLSVALFGTQPMGETVRWWSAGAADSLCELIKSERSSCELNNSGTWWERLVMRLRSTCARAHKHSRTHTHSFPSMLNFLSLFSNNKYLNTSLKTV